MEDFRLETDLRHVAGIAAGELYDELEHCSIVDALFDKVGSVPFAKTVVSAWHNKDPDGSEFLEKTVLHHEGSLP